MISLVAIPGTLLMLVALLWIADFAESRLGQHPVTEIAMAAEPVTRPPARPDLPAAPQPRAPQPTPAAAPVAAAAPVTARVTRAA